MNLPIRAQTIQDHFESFHAEHPEVLSTIIDLAKQARSRGYSHYSVKAIIERVRWHYKIERNDREFKINDHFSSRYARLVKQVDPEIGKMFELRELKSA